MLRAWRQTRTTSVRRTAAARRAPQASSTRLQHMAADAAAMRHEPHQLHSEVAGLSSLDCPAAPLCVPSSSTSSASTRTCIAPLQWHCTACTAWTPVWLVVLLSHVAAQDDRSSQRSRVSGGQAGPDGSDGHGWGWSRSLYRATRARARASRRGRAADGSSAPKRYQASYS